LDELLGREPPHFDLGGARRSLAGRAVMVTGAGGSIGSELCRQLLDCAPARLVCVDRAETPLFLLQQAMLHAPVETLFCVADIADSARMSGVMHKHAVDTVFHAAAYKHVPLMEGNPQEAVNNNVFALLSLLEAAEGAGCEDFLLISSDKAVCPSSIMGCTKRIGELIVAARPAAPMRGMAVRFGNVLGSQGSVLPIFLKEIASRQKITVTHAEMERFFLTPQAAVALLLQAFSIAEQGDVLVLDTGQPVRILDLARRLIQLSAIPPQQVEIVFTGLRPGEKLSEQLFYDFEQSQKTSVDKILRARGPLPGWTELEAHLHALRRENVTGQPERICAKLKEIVPQYLWEPSLQSRAQEVASAEATVDRK
jgi:FlaA1/EpsC-like NDP-sugar epimerase